MVLKVYKKQYTSFLVHQVKQKKFSDLAELLKDKTLQGTTFFHWRTDGLSCTQGKVYGPYLLDGDVINIRAKDHEGLYQLAPKEADWQVGSLNEHLFLYDPKHGLYFFQPRKKKE